MSKDQVWLGFEVSVDRGPLARPTGLQFWKEARYKGTQPDHALHYKSDALVGLAAMHLNSQTKHPFVSPKMNYSFCFEAWRALEPHYELFQSTQARVEPLRKYKSPTPEESSWVQKFERQFEEVIAQACSPRGIDFEKLQMVLEVISEFETKSEKSLLYNFSLKFSRPFVEKLQYLHSLLFNVRALVLLDYNAKVNDVAHEGLKIDSVSDYLPRADYTVNDALLYLSLKSSKPHMPLPVFHQLLSQFHKFSFNGVSLVENLPASFYTSQRENELEQSLYSAQMDWLLGSESGLLFRVREELFGLREGYEEIFYADCQINSMSKEGLLALNCLVTESDFQKQSAA